MGSYQVKRTEQYGPIFRTNIFFKPTVVTASEDSIAQLAYQEAKKELEAFFPPHHQKLFGKQSLLVQSGANHERLRRLIQPSMSPVACQSYQTVIDSSIKSFLDDLTLETDAFPVVPRIRGFFITIAVRVLLGTKNLEEAGLAKDLTTWSEGLLAPPLTFIPWSTAAKAMRARKRIVSKLEVLVEQEREAPTTSSLLGKLVSAVDENGDLLSADEVIDNVLTLIFAGSDTTASAATSMWMTLSLQPSLKEKLVSNPDFVASFCHQVLQSYPPAPFSMRLTKEDLDLGDYKVPAGWLVIYGFAGALHREATDWDAELTSSSVAFGAGPRMCPGRHLAFLELESLCKELIKLKWTCPEKQNLEQRYTPGFFPVDGLHVKWEPAANFVI